MSDANEKLEQTGDVDTNTPQWIAPVVAHQEWMRSPTRRLNPYTGNTTSGPMSSRLQAMVEELQDNTDWYEEEEQQANNTTVVDLTTPPQQDRGGANGPKTPGPRIVSSAVNSGSSQDRDGTQGPMTPAPRISSPAVNLTETFPHKPVPPRYSASRPQADVEGFILVGGGAHGNGNHTQTSVHTAPSPSSSTTSNRYHVLMENAVDTVREHAGALEEAAMERHRLRMERAKQEIGLAVDDAVEQINKATAKHCAEQKEQMQNFCDQQSAEMMEMLDNFTGEAERIRLEVLGRLQDGVVEEQGGVPIEDEDFPHQARFQPQTSDSGPPQGSQAQQVHHHPRWGRIDISAMPGSRMAQPTMQDKLHSLEMDLPSKDTTVDMEHYLFKLRNTHTPTVLRSSDRKAVIKFYNTFADFLQLYKVPIKSFDQLRIVHLDDPDTTLYPVTLDPTSPLYQKYTTAIYARLEEDQVLDMSDPRFEGLLSMYSRTRDGYTFLKALLAATLMTDAKNISQLSTPPPADSRAHPYEFASNLDEFFQYQAKFQRMYTIREQALMFLQGMRQVTAFTSAAAQLIHDLKQYPKTGPFPTRFASSCEYSNNVSLTPSSNHANEYE